MLCYAAQSWLFDSSEHRLSSIGLACLYCSKPGQTARLSRRSAFPRQPDKTIGQEVSRDPAVGFRSKPHRRLFRTSATTNYISNRLLLQASRPCYSLVFIAVFLMHLPPPRIHCSITSRNSPGDLCRDRDVLLDLQCEGTAGRN